MAAQGPRIGCNFSISSGSDRVRRQVVICGCFGIRSCARRESVGLRIEANVFMPTAFQFWQRTRARGYESRDLWDTKIVFTVPVNDRSYMAFDVTQTPLGGEEGSAYAEARYTQMEADEEVRWDSLNGSSPAR
jgi:hypothetical protein